MNLDKLFNMQAELDKRIVDEKGLEGQDFLGEKILALQVELGELANEWRGFKFWSKEQKARTKVYIVQDCEWCDGSGVDTEGINVGNPYPCVDCKGTGIGNREVNPLLEEYVDCLHFLLSIGNEVGKNNIKILRFTGISKEKNITDAFLSVFESVSDLDITNRYTLALSRFFELGDMLGFTWEQIEQAYYDKNKINHARQANGY